jgi:hypothetical protein
MNKNIKEEKFKYFKKIMIDLLYNLRNLEFLKRDSSKLMKEKVLMPEL